MPELDQFQPILHGGQPTQNLVTEKKASIEAFSPNDNIFFLAVGSDRSDNLKYSLAELTKGRKMFFKVPEFY